MFKVIFTVTGLLEESLVVPRTTRDAALVTSSFAGAVMFRVGGTVSTLYVVDLAVAAFPSLSLTVTVTVWEPSDKAAAGVYVTL